MLACIKKKNYANASDVNEPLEIKNLSDIKGEISRKLFVKFKLFKVFLFVFVETHLYAEWFKCLCFLSSLSFSVLSSLEMAQLLVPGFYTEKLLDLVYYGYCSICR